MFLLIAVVPESHDMEIAKAGGQFGDSFNADTDIVFAHAITFMAAILVDQFIDHFVCESCHSVTSCRGAADP